MKNKEIPFEQIALYLNNALPEKDKATLEQWIDASPDNLALFEELKTELIYLEDQAVTIDKGRVWAVINKYLQDNPAKTSTSLSKRTMLTIVSVAASVALLAGAGISLFIKSTIDSVSRENAVTMIETPVGQKMLMTLPDQTQVWLNSGSKLSYNENFNKDSREITLSGEAYFDVIHHADKEFIVNTTDVKVLVKGTSFEVSAYEEDQLVGVSLVEGKVNVLDSNYELLTKLEPNESVKVNKANMQYVLTRNSKNTFPLWTQEQLVFYNVDLFELTKKIERWYGVEIELINPIVDQKYTFSVKTESIRELLDLFNKITPIEYTVNGKEVTIRCK